MGVVGWILLFKGLLFLVFAGGVTRTLLASHPVTFDHMTSGAMGFRRFTARLRMAGFILAVTGAGLVWLAG
jgi:hypothetical protein